MLLSSYIAKADDDQGPTIRRPHERPQPTPHRPHEVLPRRSCAPHPCGVRAGRQDRRPRSKLARHRHTKRRSRGGTTGTPVFQQVVERDTQATAQNSQTPSTDVAVLIGLRSCPNNDCDSIADSSALGTILYGGTYSPISRTGGGALYANYTVSIPDTVGTGNALLSVAHFYAGGVGV